MRTFVIVAKKNPAVQRGFGDFLLLQFGFIHLLQINIHAIFVEGNTLHKTGFAFNRIPAFEFKFLLVSASVGVDSFFDFVSTCFEQVKVNILLVIHELALSLIHNQNNTEKPRCTAGFFCVDPDALVGTRQ